MTKANIALIVGATGLSGNDAGRHLKAQGWTVVTVSRSAVDLAWSDRHIAVNLEDAAACKAALAAASDVTHVFFCTWSRQASEDENVRVNAAMIRNLFDGLFRCHDQARGFGHRPEALPWILRRLRQGQTLYAVPGKQPALTGSEFLLRPRGCAVRGCGQARL